MFFVRPGRLADLDALAQMARAAQPMLHSLPPDRDVLAARLALSEASFSASIEAPGNEFYLFVLEDGRTGDLVGTASIVAAAGLEEPFYVFRNDALIHASRELHVSSKVHALTMSHELTGLTRLAGFYLDPTQSTRHGELPAGGAGVLAHLLSRARMLYIAAHRQRFTPDVFTLLLGPTDSAGQPPFWDAVGRKFFGGRDFSAAELASGGRSGTLIAEVMPRYPIYVQLLPEAAQHAVGVPHERARPSYDIHLEEGFEAARYVDIFDAGPVLMAPLERTASVALRASRTVRGGAAQTAQAGGASTVASASGAEHLVASGLVDAFRCLLAELPETGADAPLSAPARAALNVAEGERVQCVPVRARAAAAARAVFSRRGTR
jgi:arginine N-succinyltransferase